MFISLFLLCFIDFNGLSSTSTTKALIGALLSIAGFGAAVYATVCLGWRNAHGEKTGLITKGLCQWSRNPVYLLSLIGMLGLELWVNSLYIYLGLLLWASLYLLATYLEEPWLEAQYGVEYLAYKSRVSRFVGVIEKT